MSSLNQKVAVITGGASGIGKAITLRFLKEGALVLSADLNQKRLGHLGEEMKDYAASLLKVETDISVQANTDKLVDTAVRHFGRIDILVNNAGIMDNFDAVGELTDAIWEKVMRVNLDAPLWLMRKCIPLFLHQKSGVIINIASIGGLHAGRAGAAYTASKFGLIGLTKNTGYMYAKSGIRCNAIAPGGVNTHIGETIDYNKISVLANERIMSGMVLNPGMGEPEDIASVASFLASEEARFINGAVIVADGGWTAY